MTKKTITALFQFFVIFFSASSSHSEDVFLAIGSGSGDPGAKNIPITVTLDNSTDRVKGISFKIYYKGNQPHLPVTKCEGIGRASELSCQYNNGIQHIMLMLVSLGNDVIEEGTGSVLRFYYNVPAEADPGQVIDLKPTDIKVSSDIRVGPPRNTLKPLSVVAEKGSFIITGESDEEEDEEDTTTTTSSPLSTSEGDTGMAFSSRGRNNIPQDAEQPLDTSPAKTSPETSPREVSTKKTTSVAQESRRSTPASTSTPVSNVSGSSRTRVIVSPETATLTSGDLIILDPQTLDEGIVVKGDYTYEITPTSSIGSTISADGQFTAGINRSSEDIEETIKVTDTAHENASTSVVIIVAGTGEPSSECELSISPSSVTLSPGDSISFSVKNIGKKCSEGLYEWKVNSKIDSSINQQGIYRAGNNKEMNQVLDIVMVTDTVNKLSTDVIITVTGVSPAQKNPQLLETAGRTAYPKLLIFLTPLAIVVGFFAIRKFKN